MEFKKLETRKTLKQLTNNIDWYCIIIIAGTHTVTIHFDEPGGVFIYSAFEDRKFGEYAFDDTNKILMVR